jgi:hypothetical protein
VLLPYVYFSFTDAARPLIINCVDLCFLLILFILVIFPLDFCGVVLTRKLSLVAGYTFTIKRSIVVFFSDLIVKTIVFPIVFAIFSLLLVLFFIAISGLLGLLWDLLWGIDSPERTKQLLAFFEGILGQQIGATKTLSKASFGVYLALLPSIAICSAWVWLYAMSLHVVRTSVFLFDVDTKPVRSAGIVAGLGLVVLLGVYNASIRLTPPSGCASSPYYTFLTIRRSEKSLDEAIDLCPKAPLAYYLRGARYAIAQDHDRAIADFSENIRLEVHPLFALVRRADEYLAKNDYDLAISDYSEAIKHGALLQETIKQFDYLPKAMVQDLLQGFVPRAFFMGTLANSCTSVRLRTIAKQ